TLLASSAASDVYKRQVPVIWGTDAMHGHSNVYGATLFPHNIGLGAARNPKMISKIAEFVGRAVRATGITWVFAPTLAVVQDQRWGRTYESFSADPQLVAQYAGAYVEGLQGTLVADGNVVATAKHFIADGGTLNGVDRGVTYIDHEELIDVHGRAYISALEAGVQTVMISYSSVADADMKSGVRKMHGNRALITGALKEKMGFDGLVVSDWDAIGEIDGCSNWHCAEAVNAGIDLFMVPSKWKAFIKNTIEDVEKGKISMDRIDDAVMRILRVKMRSGLFNIRPSSSVYAGKDEFIKDKALAREAVSESLVLLKNDTGTLPLSRGSKVLVVGKSADDFSNQTGGWTLTWQGTDNVNSDFPEGETLLTAINSVTDSNAVFSKTGADVDVSSFDVVVAVIGEIPYAEMKGDINGSKSLFHSLSYPEDAKTLKNVSGKGVPVVTVLFSGRTVYANDLLNQSDAFVAAWLPGTEALGITDVLFRAADKSINKDFKGQLPFAWPAGPCETAGRAEGTLWPIGFGLTYETPKTMGSLPVSKHKSGCSLD
ncbi:MAG: glycoside hydrolase family 3 protein, partial [Kordiimonadaceae bacterium]|nr:glycoside hydrolase family 3 protein [Kordiimonadaceae bacterium]